MKVLSKAQMNNKVIDSLFTVGGTYANEKKIRFDMGKYQKGIIGKDISDDIAVKNNVGILWAERRTDKDGPYYALFMYEYKGK